MKALVLILVVSTCIAFRIPAQSVSFEKGQIITKNRDTIHALIELTPTYIKFVSYKVKADAPVQKIRISEIRSLVTPFNVFQNVRVNKAELLFRSVVNGNSSLLEYSEINMNAGHNVNGSTMTYYGPPTLIYSIRTNEKDCIIKKKKDTDQILPLLQNCQEALAIVNNKKFNLQDLQKVVTALNKCKQ